MTASTSPCWRFAASQWALCGTARWAGSFSASGPEAELRSLSPVGYFLSLCLCLFLFFFFSFLFLRSLSSPSPFDRSRHRSPRRLRRLSSPRAHALRASPARLPQARAVCDSLRRHRRSDAATASPVRSKEADRAVLVRHAGLVHLAPQAFPAAQAPRVCLAVRIFPAAQPCRARRRVRAARDGPADLHVPARLACPGGREVLAVPVVIAGWSNRPPPARSR
jgi:hypothetical protein